MRSMRFGSALFWVLLHAACGGDGTGPGNDGVPAVLVGTWFAGPSCSPGCRLTIFERANPADSADFAPFLPVQLLVRSSGSLTMSATGAGGSVLLEGSLEVRGDRMLVTGEEGVDTLRWTVRADTLEAEVTSHLDFEGQAVGLRARMFRQ